MQKTLAKIVAVDGTHVDLGPEFNDFYYPRVDLYLFFNETYYDIDTASFKGRVKLHDRIMDEHRLTSLLELDEYALISVDLLLSDKKKTKMILNKRGFQLTERQKQFIARMFDVDAF